MYVPLILFLQMVTFCFCPFNRFFSFWNSLKGGSGKDCFGSGFVKDAVASNHWKHVIFSYIDCDHFSMGILGFFQYWVRDFGFLKDK